MRGRRPGWLLPASAAFLPVVAAACFALLGGSRDDVYWTLFTTGAVALLLNALVLVVAERDRRRRRAAELDTAARLRVAMKDALQPLTELVAAMPYGPAAGRQAELRQVAVQAVGSLSLLLRDVDRLRAVVFALSEDGRTLQPLAYQGRASTPSPFVLGTRRGDLAIGLVARGGAVFVPDLDAGEPEDWSGTGQGYSTFVSAAIDNGQYAYGMLTVDAPHAGDLAEDDRHVVMLVADLLAIAFAEADVARAGRVPAGEGLAGEARAAAGARGPDGADVVGSLEVTPPRPARARDLTDPAVLASVWDEALADVRDERAR